MRSIRLAAAAIAATVAMAACSNDVTGPTQSNGAALSKGGKVSAQGTCRSGYMFSDGRCIPAPQ